MKNKLIKIIEELKVIIANYEKNPNNIGYSGALLERAKPKHAYLHGKLYAYKYALQLLEKEENEKGGSKNE